MQLQRTAHAAFLHLAAGDSADGAVQKEYWITPITLIRVWQELRDQQLDTPSAVDTIAAAAEPAIYEIRDEYVLTLPIGEYCALINILYMTKINCNA